MIVVGPCAAHRGGKRRAEYRGQCAAGGIDVEPGNVADGGLIWRRVGGRRVRNIEEKITPIHCQAEGSASLSRRDWSPRDQTEHAIRVGTLRFCSILGRAKRKAGDHPDLRIGDINKLAGMREQNLSWIRIRGDGRSDRGQSARAGID